MSATSEITTAPPAATTVEAQQAPQSRQRFAGLGRDIILWRRKYLSLLVLAVATATWAALQVYRFNFVPLVSWVAMLLVTLLFVWGIIHRLLGKEAPEVAGMEISEGSAVGMANEIREWTEQGMRWVFRVSSASSRREWFQFAATVASSWLLSLMASRFDLLTLLYAALLVSLTTPVIYVKHERKIKEYGWRLRMQSQRCYAMIQEKLFRLKDRVTPANKKEKKRD